MGFCFLRQSRSRKARKTGENGKGRGIGEGSRGAASAATESFRRPSTAMVINMADGARQEFKQPIKAAVVTAGNPECFLCNSESMYVGDKLPCLGEDDELQPGQIYFLIPLSRAQKPLSLPELCDLAIKASSALHDEELHQGQ